MSGQTDARDLAVRACNTLRDSGLDFDTLAETASAAKALADSASRYDPQWQPLSASIGSFADDIAAGTYGYNASVEHMIDVNTSLSQQCAPLGVRVTSE